MTYYRDFFFRYDPPGTIIYTRKCFGICGMGQIIKAFYGAAPTSFSTRIYLALLFHIRTNRISDQWDFEPMAFRNNDM